MNKAQKQKRIDEILTKAEAEKRNLTDQEEIEINGLEISLKQDELLDKRTQRSIPIPQPQRGEGAAEEYQERGIIGGLKDPKKFFFNGRVPVSNRTMTQYIGAVIQGQNMVPDEIREMSLGSGVHGGFAAPETYAAGFWQATNNESVCLPLCRMYDFQGSNILHVVAWDSENQSAGPWGGVAAAWVPEGGTSTPVEPDLRTLTYKANKLTMFVDVTREASQNAQGLVAELGSAMTRAAVYEFDNCIINGNGVARPLGILQSGSAINVARAVANQISYADVVSLYRRLYPGFIKNAAWFASPDTIGQLLTLSDPASHYIWTPSSEGVANSRPGYLLGLPVYLTDKCPALGSRGDLILADLSAYGVAVAQQVVLEKTESAKWYQDIYSFRAILRAGGGPMMDSPITPKNNGASLSWAVVLE
jgi:HK97 family phage major capsid protein